MNQERDAGSPQNEAEKRNIAPDLTIVIPARDEAAVLESTLESLNSVAQDLAQIHVVADHCRDATAAIAARAGVCVHVRNDRGPVGKGPALHWWLARTRTQASPGQIVLVMDADSRVQPGFIEHVRTHFVNGNLAAQARIEPSLPSKTPLALLASLSEIVEHRVFDTLRARLGWSVRLRGTGMAFRRELLERFSGQLHTSVEDLELTILIGAAGVPIAYLPEIAVLDPKPNDLTGAVHQRARWLRGQFQVMRAYASRIVRLLLRGPNGWSLLSSGLLKPKTLILPVKMATTLGFLRLAALRGDLIVVWKILALLGGFSILIDFLVYLYGLRFARHRWETLAALAASPAYLILWVRSLAMAIVHRHPWLRSRRTLPDKPCQSTTQMN